MTACPLCGAPSNWRDLTRAPWEREAMAQGYRAYERDVYAAGMITQAVRGGATYERRRPTRPAQLDSDVWVPICQSLMSGVIGALLAGAGAGLAGAGTTSFLWAGIGGAGTLGLTWFIVLGEHRRALEEVERIVGADLDGDGHIGAPAAPEREPIQVQIEERDRRDRLRRVRYVKLPPGITDEDIRGVAVAILQNDVEFSRRGLADVLSAEKYRAIYQPMLSGGLVRYANGKNAANGVELTGAGRAFLRQFVVVGGGGW